jgi:hypothetical protein
MPIMGRLCAALAVPLVLPAAAEAQISRSDLVAPVEAGFSVVPARSGLPDFRVSRGDLRETGRPPRSGLIGSLPITANLNIGVGRFRVLELARPRSNMEPERRPTDMQRRDRGIAAVGFSFRF